MSHTSEGARARRSVPRWLRVLIPVALILAWLAVGAAGGSAFGEVNDVAENDQAQFLPASADATRVSELQTEFRGDDVIPALIVFERDGGVTDADHEAIGDIIDHVATIDGVVDNGVSPAIDSEDGEAVEIVVSIDAQGERNETVAELRGYLADHTPEGLSAAVTGPAGLSADIVDAFSGLDGLLLAVALGVVLVILIIVYRSPLLPLIVLGTSMMALTAAIFVVVQLAKADVLVLSGQTQGILMILVIGAATDYSLLYVSRYREALREHERKWDATWTALRGSTPAILASGGTVIAGLLCLLFSELNSNKALGPVAAIGIVFALIAALTLLPALLLWAGRVAFWPIRPVYGSEHKHAVDASAKGLWPAAARLVSRRPRTVWVACALVLAAASVGLVGLKADGVSQSEFVTGYSEAREGQAVLDDHFPGGSGTPAVIVAPEDRLDEVAKTVLDTDGVDSLAVVTADAASGTAQVTADGIKPAFGKNGPVTAEPTVIDGKIMLEATLDGPGDSVEAEDTVRELRSALPDSGSDAVLIGGVAATAIDTNDAATHDRNLIIPLVLVVILVILMLLLRSILAPVLLVLTVVLSFAAALGVSSLVFNGLFQFPGADPSVPMFGFVFLVALGIDYNIFLMTRVREESVKHGTREGITRGLVATGGVITSAGIVLAATFAALGVLPILFLAQISFIVAFGVLLDTIIVRSLLVPALSYDIGRAIWWPSRLSRPLN
ncbi:putative drug exporter of the RND superfamily [Paramicrobacterium humi]|uniref:Putative drug exporter of the RND superfamily n=1 Tax=Paramicrobacterium humi TaxID=640635 RepID=A0A1H4M8F5_9MICO|nr:MMPL family transporter [Microbacterium humi]SEB79361.1 putative drug exporter of the RND superfamily [Microbacterium humi]